MTKGDDQVWYAQSSPARDGEAAISDSNVRNALVSLECTIQWLQGGCDPKAAAEELRGVMRMLHSAQPVTTTPTATEAAISDAEIREVFLANGFTIKEGLADLKPYVYSAARAILAKARPVADSTPAAGVPEDASLVTMCCGRRECGGECGNEWRGMCSAHSESIPDPDNSSAASPTTREAERIINRLMSSDPQFDDCSDAADLIRKLIEELRATTSELLAATAKD